MIQTVFLLDTKSQVPLANGICFDRTVQRLRDSILATWSRSVDGSNEWTSRKT